MAGFGGARNKTTKSKKRRRQGTQNDNIAFILLLNFNKDLTTEFSSRSERGTWPENGTGGLIFERVGEFYVRT